MRKSLVLVGICAFLAATTRHSSSTISTLSVAAGPTAIGAAQKPSNESDLNARISRIENGLLPEFTIRGQPGPATIGDRMKKHNVPGVSIAFFDHGQILWTRTYGYADVASKKVMTSETLFQAASISKPISALAVLRLVQEGKLNLDEDVNIKLRSWKVPENEFTKEQKVTLRRILSHSAGLTIPWFLGYTSNEALPTAVQILNGERPANTEPIRFETVPGTVFRYSGGGYVVMQLVLTDVSGRPFPQILNDLVLRLAGMTHSTYEQPLPKSLWSFAATPYRWSGEPVRGGWRTYPEMAAAGLWTTPSDLARLAIEVQNEYAGKSSKLLSQQMMREMLTHQKGGSGLGFALEAPGHKLRFAHSGWSEGFQCDLEAYTESGPGIVIMTNSDDGGNLIAEVLRSVAKEYSWPDFQPIERVVAKIDPAVLAADVGTYEESNEGVLTVSVRDDRLYLQDTG
jgi:CubicO group peptidase (beta-lactamase class C family)